MSRSSSDSDSSLRLPPFATNKQEMRRARSPKSSVRASSRSKSRNRSRKKFFGSSKGNDDYFSSLNSSGGPGFHSPPILEDDDELHDILADQPELPNFGSNSISMPYDQSSRRRAIEEEMDLDAMNVFHEDFRRVDDDVDGSDQSFYVPMGSRHEDANAEASNSIQAESSALDENSENDVIEDSVQDNRGNPDATNRQNDSKKNSRPRVKFDDTSGDVTTENENEDEISKEHDKIEGNLEEGSSGTVTNEANEEENQGESFKDRFKRKMNFVFNEDDDIPTVPGDDNFLSRILNLGDAGGLVPGASKAAPRKEHDEEEHVGFEGGQDSIPLHDLSPDILHSQAKSLIKDHDFYQHRNETGSTFDFYTKNPEFEDDSDEFDGDMLDGRDSVVHAPRRYQAGVLSSLLKLYLNPALSLSSQTLTRSDDESMNSGRSSPFPKMSDLNLKDLKNKLKRIGNHVRSPSSSSLFNSDDETFTGSSRTKIDRLKPSSISGLLHSSKNNKGEAKKGEIDNLPSFQSTRPKVNRKKKMLKSKREATKAKITVHIADILQKQRFIVRICKALMLFGAPTHRLEEYMMMTARVLEIDGQFIYFPGVMLISFGDSATRTSEVQVVRCAQGLNLSKLNDAHKVYKAVVHDMMGVEEASIKIDELLSRKQIYPPWFCVFLYGLGSAMVTSWGFRGGWRDIPISFGIGLCVGFLQFYVSPRSSLYSNVFEVTSSIVVSFLGRALGSINNGKTFCFGGIVQGSLALILPGYIILCGSLELQSRNLVAGSVRMFYAIIYSLFLGFGITLGAALYGWIDHNATSDTTCPDSIQLSPWFRFLFVPGFATTLGLINQARVSQLPSMVIIAGLGYVVTYFAGKHFTNSTEFTASMGAFVIGILGNLYSRVGRGMAVSAMLPAIFVQVPSGIASQSSLLSGVQTADTIVNNSTTTTSNGNSLSFGVTMVEVAIGISVGLYAATLVVYPLGKKSTGLFTL